MKHNKITIAVQATTAAMILGVAGQASAFEFSAGDVDAEVYGYARLNAVYDIDADIGLTTQSGNFTNVINDGATGFFDADAQQSRLGLTATHSSGVKVNLETDFRGGSFRLRHAYGEYQNWLAGRTWSNFSSFVGYTPTLDFDSLAGNAGVQDRSAQLRYTAGPLSVSLEDPRFQRIAGVQAGDSGFDINDDGTVTPVAPTEALQTNASEDHSLPALTARFQQELSDVITVSVAGLVQQVKINAGDDDESAFGYGVFAAASFALSGAISIQGAFNYTDGASGYLYRSGSGGFGAADAYLKDGDLETIAGYGGTLGVSADVGPGSLNVGYGFATVDWDDAAGDMGSEFVGAEHKTNSNAFVNYQMTPVENVMIGVEYGYFNVDRQDDESGDANRVLFAAQYSF